LALAGANAWLAGHSLPDDVEDGLLTAVDVAGLDLLNTEVVVLSACETGLGQVLSGEGVFGLRRAFHVAGTRALVVSLKEYLAEHPEVVAEDFPGYAPELNPDELVWCWAKYGRLANYAPEGLGELRLQVLEELEYLRRHAYALLDFIDHTKLPLE